VTIRRVEVSVSSQVGSIAGVLSRTSSRSCRPKAAAHVEFDESWTSPSLPRAYPIVPVRGEGLDVEDIDGNLFLDFAAASRSTRPAQPPAGRRSDQGAGAELIHFSAADFYLPIYPEVCKRLAEIAPMDGRPAPTSATRGGGGRGGDQARPLRDEAPVHRARSSAHSMVGPTGREP
jgi:4-aminobutyrate aminotransferase